MKRPVHIPVVLLLALGLMLGALPSYARDASAPTVGESGLIEIEDTGVYYTSNFTFTIDPFGRKGRGQIFSDPIWLVNNNSYPVHVELVGLSVLANSPDVVVCDRPVCGDLLEPSPDKEIFMLLRQQDEEEQDVPLDHETLRDPVSVTLGASRGAVEEEGVAMTRVSRSTATLGESGTSFWARENATAFELAGSVNPVPEELWRAGDVSVSMSFKVTPLVPSFLRELKEKLENTPSVGYSA